MALSEDGRQLAFVAGDSTGSTLIWVRALDEAEPRALQGTEGATCPFWSPDGHSLGFFAEGKLKRIDVTGGPPQVLADSPFGLGGAWSRDGIILFSPDNPSSIMRVAASGGAPAPTTGLSKSEPRTGHSWPAFLPDGRHFLYASFAISEAVTPLDGIYVGAIDRKQNARLLLPAAQNAVYARPGRLVFWREGALWAQPFDERHLRMTGEAVRVADHVTIDPELGCGLFSASQTATLAYQQGGSPQLSELAWVDRAGKTIATIAAPALYYSPRLSHDGRRVAVDRSDPVSGQCDIWIFDLARGVSDRITFDPANESSPDWSADDSRVFWVSSVGAKGGGDIHSKSVSGAGHEETVFASDGWAMPLDCSRDGKFLVFAAEDSAAGTVADLRLLSLGDLRASTWLATPFDERNARFSPDGRWIAYQSDESGRPEVYVQRFPQGGDRWRVSTVGGTSPLWRGDGHELFYLSQDRRVMSVAFRTKPTVEIGAPAPLFQTDQRTTMPVTQYDVTADGQRFVINRMLRAQVPTMITLDQNWSPNQ